MVEEIVRSARKPMSPQEGKLWDHLRSWRKRGIHFRRQAPRDRCVIDFVCLKQRLIIEVDDGQIGLDTNTQRDGRLSNRGFRVLRVESTDVDRNLDGVLALIDRVLHGAH
jgi:very-short-patch-repair endonuclease